MMKAHIKPRVLEDLPKTEIHRIEDFYKEELHKNIVGATVSVQKIMLKFMCIILHGTFGFDEHQLTQFLGSFRRIYRHNATMDSGVEQQEWLDKEMAKCFPEGGYPEELIQSYERIGIKDDA